MLFFRLSSLIMVLVWILSLTMWLMPEQMRWDMGLFHVYTSTFLELPFLAVLIGVVGVFLRKRCTSPRLFKATMFLSWGYVGFPLITSALLILVTFLGITGY
ncbi:membrane hypothetical protein [Candidatus Terasakiella magnetica]|uniref:Uncharacterized protein n=1 Tax=Candidatus Terasakiella magnetica TaxID=1867952 RepID=A0A1C3RCT8_9PROT|nr:hypothetical protein [Candidatus Terasakiella magnetica]SCA55097.1 membrane hypothetical protein [Candidatus Terasakiella magnetica]